MEKKHIDFHLKYGHADIYQLLKEKETKNDLSAKLESLCQQKKILENDIKIMKEIIDQVDE